MGVFAEWQPRYAQHGIATFPLIIEGRTKKPATSGYTRVGLRGSEQLAYKFPDINALAFMAGKRNNITVIDIDSPDDEGLLRDSLERHGDTPLISRTGSGGFHCYYQHSGEPRKVRPDPDTPIDLLGGGVLAAPPSQGGKGTYSIIRGSVADLHRLPFIRGGSADHEGQHAVARGLVKAGGRNKELIGQGGRSNAMLEHLRSQYRYCDDLKQLVDVGRTFADQNFDRSGGHEYTDSEIQNQAKSVWKWCQEREANGELRVGSGRWLNLPANRAAQVLALGPDAAALFLHLQIWSNDREVLTIANGMRCHMMDGEWTLRRFVAARSQLLEAGIVTMIRPASTYHGPAAYSWT